MAQRAVLVGSVVLAGALLGASAPWSRDLPACSELPAAQREAARLAGRCEGLAPVVSTDPKKAQGKTVREATLPRRPVPELRGRLFNRRDERLAVYVVNVDYRESALRRDWVIDQVPRPPATLPQGGNLRVVLSDGALVRVPDVRGSFARALTRLYRAGLSWSAGDGPTGAVIGQLPAAGAAVRPGTEIVLRLAPGPVALAPESTRPEVAPAPTRTPPAPATAPAARPAPGSSPPATAPTDVPTTATTAMPDLHGMIFDAARERLPGVNVQRVHRAGTEPGGTVIGQTPAAGTPLTPGATVRLVLSDGSLVRVPRVVSFSINEARQRLAAGEMRLAITNVPSDSPAGTVTSQQPAEGAIAQRGSTIRLNVSSGRASSASAAPATVAVPNLVGSTVERARRELDRFKVERSERAAREPVGTIVEQVPAPGTQVAAGSPLAIIVSSGGRPETIEVANVVGQGADDATRALSEFRLERETVPSIEPAGSVLAQDPPAKASAAPGSTVRLRVSDGSLVRAPSFAHMTLAQAREAASGAGLTLAPAQGDDDPAARVQRQEPAAGTEVARGSALQVTLEDRALPFGVPSGVRDAWTRTSKFMAAQSSRDVAIALVVLLALLVLLLVARRRGRTTYAPVEPVFGPTRHPVDQPPARVHAPAPRWGDRRPRTPAPSVTKARTAAPIEHPIPSSVARPVAPEAVAPEPAATPPVLATLPDAPPIVTPRPAAAPPVVATTPTIEPPAPPPVSTPPPIEPRARAPVSTTPTIEPPGPAPVTTTLPERSAATPLDVAPAVRQPPAAPPVPASPARTMPVDAVPAVKRPAASQQAPVPTPGASSSATSGAAPGIAPAAVRAPRAPLPPAEAAARASEPVAFGARARLEGDPNGGPTTNATPRGPEIRISAWLKAGEDGYRDLSTAQAPSELTEETK